MKISTASRVVGAIVASLFVVGAFAAERSYPTKPVRFVVPYAPGGGADITARAIGQKLGESLGQTVVIDNRAGATGLVGTEVVARAPADGYTLLLADPAHTINNVIQAKPAYDAVKDFTPIMIVATTPLAIMAHPSFTSSLKELVAMPKAQTEKIAIGTAGQLGIAHMSYLLMRTRTGLTLNVVPYKGAGPAISDAVGGQIPLALTSLAAGVPHLKAGRLKGLGIIAPARSSLAPDMPTLQEAGLKGVNVTVWYGVFAPSGTPNDIVALLNREIKKAVEAPAVRERLAALALDIAPSTPAELRKLVDDDLKLWRDVVARSGERLELR